jgi:hypothetical protein
MMTFRVLGAFWLAFCCYHAFNIVHGSLTFRPKRPLNVWFWIAYTLAGSETLVGIVASIELILGATWARWLLSLNCIFQMTYYFSKTEMAYYYSKTVWPHKNPFRIWDHIVLAFALVSLVILFWPQRG